MATCARNEVHLAKFDMTIGSALEVGWYGVPALPWPPGKHTSTSFLKKGDTGMLCRPFYEI